MSKFIDIIKSKDKTKHDKLAEILAIIIKENDIKPDSYFILGSYALREARTINDLDINMDYDEFTKLPKEYGKVEQYNNQIRWFFDLTDLYREHADSQANDFSIEIFQKKPFEGYPDEKYSLKYLKDTNGLSKDKFGHQFFSLETLIKWKTQMGRAKDKPDIELANRLLQLGGGNNYKYKYMKYKTLYLNLKNKQMH